VRRISENGEVKYTRKPARNGMNESVHWIAVQPQ
jgi:hypothetical protein